MDVRDLLKYFVWTRTSRCRAPGGGERSGVEVDIGERLDVDGSERRFRADEKGDQGTGCLDDS